MSSSRQRGPQSRPRTYKLSLKSLLALPFRICNPPPAVSQVRSCSVTPVFNVRLEDVLDRKHLPPLGLKDFEEWLLYVEMSPENLYFILWLREYTVRYRQWTAQHKSSRRNTRHWSPQCSSQLAMFYARAKQTFFTPNSNYELNLPSHLLAPFHSSNTPLHPDPAVFDEVAIETQKMLKESLHRFVSAQFNNVGNNRVICGLIAGTFCCLVGAVFPLLYNLLTSQSRWLRLSALPGLWLGLTLLFTSLNGVCLGVYLFGDLRQLRKFELSRPPISKPRPISTPRERSIVSSPITGLPITPIIPLNRPPEYRNPSLSRPILSSPLVGVPLALSIPISPPPPAYSPTRPSRPSSQMSIVSSRSLSCGSQEATDSDQSCYISPAYYDHDPVEGPATGLFTFPPEHVQPKSAFEHDDDSSFSTAGFIHPFEESDSDDECSLSPSKIAPEVRQRVDSFDFDSLPPRSRSESLHLPLPVPLPMASTTSLQVTPSIVVIQPEAELEDNSMTPKGFLRRMQSRCNINKWLVMTSSTSVTDLHEKAVQPPTEKPEYDSNFPRPHPSLASRKQPWGSTDVKKQFKMVKAVPAFASPLTRIHSPIVVRGQWEIVVRSTVIACFVSWTIVGAFLAVPAPVAHTHH